MLKGQRSRNRRTSVNAPALRAVEDPAPVTNSRVLFFSDIHFPYQDDHLVERLLDQIASEEFTHVVNGGDCIDAYSISKYDPDPSRINQLGDELELAKEFHRKVAERTSASKHFLLGNHEQRIPQYLRRKAPALERLRCLQLESLLGLDDAGFQYHGREGFKIGSLRLKHGDKVAKGAGNSVRKELDDHWTSVVMGHCHRRAVVPIRKDDTIHKGIEAGCLCKLDVEYLSFPDWQQGWVVVEQNPDGVHVTEVEV